MDQKSNGSTQWAKLDNAGKIYPSLVSARNTTLFRISALLDKPIHATLMQDAIDALASRFPYYHVHLQRGAFWYFFIPSDHPVKLEKDSRYPCMKMPIRQRTRIPFRVRAHKNSLAVEFSHILTDGTGALIYLQALLVEYLKRRESIKGNFSPILQPEEQVNPQEGEDAFQRFYKRDFPLPRRLPKACKWKGQLDKRGIYHVTTGTVETKKLLQVSKEHGLSVTGFLTAVLMDVFQDYLKDLPPSKRKRLSAPIRVCVPINLRRFFPSSTLRNFFLSLNPEIDPRLGEYTFQEICHQVKHFMKSQINEKNLNQQISRNIKGERRWVVRIIPSWIKDLIIPWLYRRFGESTYSTVLSNLGKIDFPEEMQSFIKRLDFVPNPPEGTTRFKLGVISFKDKATITFGRISPEPDGERRFFRKLVRLGIPVWIDGNTWLENSQQKEYSVKRR